MGALSLTKLINLKKLLLLNQKLSAAQNGNFNKSLILETMRILRFGKRYCVHIGEIYKHTKFQVYGPNTRPVYDWTNFGILRFKPAVIYSLGSLFMFGVASASADARYYKS